MSYLQLPTRKVQEENRQCTRYVEAGHWKHYCRATTWCRFCTSETHATQACRKYANFVRDNPIASIRRTTPVQEQRRSEPPCVNVLVQQQHQQGTDQRLLFPQPPTQQFQAPVVPTVETRNKHPLQRQSYLQRSSQDVKWDPRFQHPPPQ